MPSTTLTQADGRTPTADALNTMDAARYLAPRIQFRIDAALERGAENITIGVPLAREILSALGQAETDLLAMVGPKADPLRRIAAAIRDGRPGVSVRLTRLVDGVSTYTAEVRGLPPHEFDDRDEATEWAGDAAALIQARAVDAALDLSMTDAARDVLAERRAQVEQCGFTAEHDDARETEGQMAGAAACYAFGERLWVGQENGVGFLRKAATIWPWAEHWWKPSTRRHDLVKAGALIFAEIERLDRAEMRAQSAASGGKKLTPDGTSS